MMQHLQRKHDTTVQGGNILELAGGAKDVLSVELCMKKLKGETKTDNMPTVNKEMTEWRSTRRGIMGAFCGWSVWWRGQNWGWTGHRREIMLQTKTHEPFPKIGTVWCSKNEPRTFLCEENVDLLFYFIISTKFFPDFPWTIVKNLRVAPPVLPAEAAWIQLANLYNFSIKQCVQITFLQISWKETFSRIRLE